MNNSSRAIRSLVLGSSLLLASLSIAHAGPVKWGRTSAPVPGVSAEEASVEQAMLAQINRVRASHHLAPVKLDRALSAVARKHAQQMSRLHFFDHMSPVAGNRTPGDRARMAGINYHRLTENIAVYPYRLGERVILSNTGRRTPQDPSELARTMIEGYLESPGHRANLLDPRVTRVGVGIRIAGGKAYNTQNFVD